MTKKPFNLTALFGIFVVFLNLTCCKDCPDCPTEPEPEGEHLFYVGGPVIGGDSWVKIFSVEQSKFIDSLTVRFERFQMAVTDDDGLLLVAGYPTGFDAIDLKTKEVIYSVDNIGRHITVSPDGRYFASGNTEPPWGRQIYTAEGFELVYSDTTGEGFAFGEFVLGSEYYVYSRFPGSVVAYNVIGDSVEAVFDVSLNGEPLWIYHVWPSLDNTKLFFIAGQVMTLYLGVTDFGEDSVRILRAPLKTGGEDAVVSPDNKHLYFVNMPYADYEMPSASIYIYDVASEAELPAISTREPVFYEPYEIALTSDGKYLMVISDVINNYDQVLLANARSFSVIGVYAFGEGGQQALALCTKR